LALSEQNRSLRLRDKSNYSVPSLIPGKLDSDVLDQAITKGNGKATYKTVEGGTLTVSGSGKDLTITDEKRGTAMVTIADVDQSNRVIMFVNKVLMPN
jgi:uncharacterized surface protein with fasciclin (FAS1) repeats